MREIVCASQSLLLLLTDGQIILHGHDSEMKLVALDHRVSEVASSSSGFALIDQAGIVHEWKEGEESNMYEIVNQKPAYNGSKLTSISIGDDFGIVTDELGNVFGWGNNEYG